MIRAWLDCWELGGRKKRSCIRNYWSRTKTHVPHTSLDSLQYYTGARAPPPPPPPPPPTHTHTHTSQVHHTRTLHACITHVHHTLIFYVYVYYCIIIYGTRYKKISWVSAMQVIRQLNKFAVSVLSTARDGSNYQTSRKFHKLRRCTAKIIYFSSGRLYIRNRPSGSSCS